MISIDTIKKLAVSYQTTGFNIVREYCQHLFLSYFYQHKSSTGFLFKGGTALRFIYKSPRFSEDLDFTNVATTKPRVEDIVQNTLVEIERLGLGTALNEFGPTSGGYIVTAQFSLLDYDISVQLNISSRRNKVMKGEAILIVNDFLPSYNLIQLPQDLLIEEKLKALLGRAKPRDYFDLYFILRSNLLTAKGKKNLTGVHNRLKHERRDIGKELKIFLPKSHHHILKDFSASLEKELRRFL